MKQPNWKPTLILSATVFVLGSFTYWLQFSHKPKKDRVDAQSKKPLNFTAESTQIAAFKIKSSSGLIEGKCESLSKQTCKVGSTADWSITYPEALKGDGDTIRDYLNNASGMSSTETISLSEETPEKRASILEEYGLSDGKRTSLNTQFIELTLEGGKKVTAWFGENHPIGDKIFVASSEDGKINTDTIFLVANFYRNTLFEKTLSHFRDKTIFNFDRAEVDQFEAKLPSGKLTGKLTEGLWQINGMESDYDRVETLLSSIAQAKAKEFPSESELKGSKTFLNYTLHLKNGSRIQFELLSKASKLYLRSPDLKLPYEVESNFVVQSNKKLNELRRNLLLTQGEKIGITRMRLEGGSYSSPAEFSYEGKAWIQKDKGTSLDVTRVQPLLDKMASDHSPEIVSPAPPQKGDSLRIILGDEKNPSKFRYLIYEVQGKSYARNLDNRANEAFLSAESIKNTFPIKADSWKVK